jgi:hypothetical protein
MRLPYAIPLYALLVLLLAGCATGPTIRSNEDPGTNFAQYDSFAFVPELESEDLGYQSFLVQYLKEAITREMQARGYAYSEENPKLLVNFYVNTQEKIQSRSTPTAGGGYYGYRRGYYGGWGGGYETTVTQYTQGTLSIDVVDAARKQLVWEGVAEGRIRQSTLDDIEGAVNRVVPLIFQEYPHQAGIQ